jgi:hypothetical protein
MKDIIFLYLILATFIECGIKVNDFCHKIEINGKKIECNDDFNLSCTKMTCSTNRYSCQSLKFFSGINNFNIYGHDGYDYLKKKFDLFKNQIKNCTHSLEYKWNPNDVCLNIKISLQLDSLGIRLKKMKPDECDGKYNFKCNNFYCASDKRACDELKMAKNNSKINKCKQFIGLVGYFKTRF